MALKIKKPSKDELKQWAQVDKYFANALVPNDSVLNAVTAASRKAGLPEIEVSETQGKFLQLLVKMCRARRVLEIGALGGYSAVMMARALPPDGQLISLEFDPKHAAVAQANIAQAGLAGIATVRVGAALDLLDELIAQNSEPFDFVFIDADKVNTPAYLRESLRLSRKGTVIVADNVVRGGEILDPECTAGDVQGMRAFFEIVAAEPRLEATAMQTVGSKGWDGFAMAIVVSD